jgi:hypothetical protein
MRQKFLIVLTIALVVGLLIVLNLATYATQESERDSEGAPNRSTYHSGPTGTRAFYDFLSESGYRVIRWRETTEKLLSGSGQQVHTFVVVGRTKLQFEKDEADALLFWVSQGGHLILIDRTPDPELLPKAGNWKVQTYFPDPTAYSVDPTNSEAMTAHVDPLKPAQPTILTRDVDQVAPSRLASPVKIISEPVEISGVAYGDPTIHDDEEEEAPQNEISIPTTDSFSVAPVVHLGNSDRALLLDYRRGSGRIVLLSDPYIVANNGIGLQDNLQLAVNLVTASGGLIAFDEYHQGRGVTENAFVAYFSGTPILAICGQLLLLALVLVWTRGRRFARPLPLPAVDRRSKLEFVASMAELQERSKAYDLAIENIYSRTRRVLARFAGVDYNSSRSEIASRVASRSSLESHQLETLMRQCEETINGAPISSRQSIDLVRRLREVERTLGLQMRSRDVRQAAEHV